MSLCPSLRPVDSNMMDDLNPTISVGPVPAWPPPPPSFPSPPEIELCKLASQHGDLDTVKYAFLMLFHFEQRFQPQRPQYRDVTPGDLGSSLTVAIEQEHIHVVQYLLEQEVSAGRDVNYLEHAVRGRKFKVLELLLHRGWYINMPLGRIKPPVLHIPLCHGDQEMVDWLLDHGADPNARCYWDYTAASDPMYMAPLQMVKHILSRGVDVKRGELLQWAIFRETPEALDVVKWLVERGAPINKVKYEDEPEVYYERKLLGLGTPLHRAAEFGHATIVTFLIEQGANPLIKDSKGYAPRFWAEKNGHLGIVDQLRLAEDRWRAKL